jgi:protein-disulfide isomerase
MRKLLVFVLAIALCVVALPAAQQGTESSRTVGPLMARVTVEVFSDFQCPACKALHEQTLSRVRDDYARKGKIRLVRRDFPLPMHAFSKQAAILANAADRIGKYDQVSDALFRQQESWAASGKVQEVVDSVLTPAEAQRVHELAKDPAIAAAIQRDVDLGNRLKVNQTPTLIVTRDLKPERVAGFVTYQILSRFLDQLLAQ